MNERLKAAPSSGAIKSLYSIIGDDAYVLDRIDEKPSLAKKLNPKGRSPIRLAMKNNQTEIVFRLAEVDRDLESALHIAVKKDKVEALKILLKWTKQASMKSILNWSDDKGNNNHASCSS
ncbi:unnamed protein product [Citrullus colocynthis]|uniref:Ankyrin repeat protein n=1 Tax=Citrullus colocynthis TaxID=252529 RepID=A0ABP0XRL6_9ROSI